MNDCVPTVWHENFKIPDDTVDKLITRYSKDYFLKGEKEWGWHYTGYHRNPYNSAATVNGGFLDRQILDLYKPKLKEVIKILGLNDNKAIYSFNSIWAQLYKKDLRSIVDVHNHYMEPKQLISWVHFLKVPNQKCFYFYQNNKKVYPDMQNEFDMIFYPSYIRHGVDMMTEGDLRFVIVGNIRKVN